MKIIELAFAVTVPLVALASGSACSSSTPLPTARLASSEAAIRAARELGAQEDPQAALHLRLADEQLTLAKDLIRDKENERAAMVLDRARSDAELAVMLTYEKNAKAEAKSTHERLDRKPQIPSKGQNESESDKPYER